ncbi:DJ-1/PfpI family protein [Catellatospora sp. NPDC049111]|uniref:DJ-1/PfpI family protein n=1 Tax=Catellatospora sp. NPDC049111 TaxID=3155271 RepID=UPI0033C6F7AD
MSGELAVAFLVSREGIEQVELTEPWRAVEQVGATPRLLSPEPGKVQAYRHLEPADTFAVDEVADDADPAAFAALVLPGGVANGDLLRWQEPAREFVPASWPPADRSRSSATAAGSSST